VRELPLVLAVVLLVPASPGARAQGTETPPEVRPVNVILMIGEGMGFPHVTLARMATSDAPENPLFFERLPVFGYATTHSASGPVPDGAASATALATGRKGVAGALSMTESGKPIRTLLEAAEEAGMTTGLVTTSRLTDPTMAAFAVHHGSDEDRRVVARSMAGAELDLLLGGGARYVRGPVLETFTGVGFHVVRHRRALSETEPGTRVLGLFADVALRWAIDRDVEDGQPDLPAMTTEALRIVGDEPGFFLVIGGGRIDEAGHAHDAAALVREIEDFDRAVRVAVEWAREDGDTLIVVAGDHSTGGLAIPERLDVAGLARVRKSAERLAGEIRAGEDPSEVMAGVGVRDLTGEEVRSLGSGRSPFSPILEIGHLVSARLGVIFFSTAEQGRHGRTLGHEGTVVPVYAFGAGAGEFSGAMDNTDIPRRIARLRGLELER